MHEVWAAVDPGLVINPDNVLAQVEGGTVMGVSLALRERITITDGVVQQSSERPADRRTPAASHTASTIFT